MIKVAGREYRTLAQPLTVNGKYVREVYANGKKVYPEEARGNYIKFRGFTTNAQRIWHEKLDVFLQPSTADVQERYVRDIYRSMFAVTASFVISMPSNGSDLYLDDPVRIPECSRSFYCEEQLQMKKHTGFDYTDQGRTMKLNIMPWSTYNGAGYLSWITQPIHGSFTFGLNEGVLSNLKIMYRMSVTPIGISDYYLRYSAQPLGGMAQRVIAEANPSAFFQVCDWNNQLLHEEGTGIQYMNLQGERKIQLIGRECFSGNGKFGLDFYMDWDTIKGLSVSFRDLSLSATMKRSGWEPGDWAEDYPSFYGEIKASIENCFNIPITEIMYLGDKEEAPEWAQNVYPEDLL